MKIILLVIFMCLSCLSHSQEFSLSYQEVGYGPNKGMPSLVLVSIQDTSMSYRYYNEQSYSDTIGEKNPNEPILGTQRILVKTHFRRTSIDSIAVLFNSVAGKHIIVNDSNANGSKHILNVQLLEDCSQITLDYAIHPIAQKIIDIVNSYLPVKKRIYVQHQEEENLWEESPNIHQNIEKCVKVQSLNKGIQPKEYDIIKVSNKG